MLVPAGSWRKAVLTSRLSAAPSPPYTDNASAGAAICFAIDCHARGAKVSYTQRYSSAPPRQGVARAVTHFLLLLFILTVKVFNPKSVLTSYPF